MEENSQPESTQIPVTISDEVPQAEPAEVQQAQGQMVTLTDSDTQEKIEGEVVAVRSYETSEGEVLKRTVIVDTGVDAPAETKDDQNLPDTVHVEVPLEDVQDQLTSA